MLVKRMGALLLPALLIAVSWIASAETAQQRAVVPHGQDQLPGPPLSPAEAIAKMTVPEGFTVELVAGEPQIVNPVAMTFDERGRIWIAESLEYPRRSAGPGRDRIKVLESTKGDGTYDKVSIFAEGLNIPSGIVVGHGGVWVANSPDILFMQDTDGDGKADRREVVVTGFGRTDTHELPNSLTWGPDGWLYGLNGVFNYSHVRYRGKEYQFTCALFRIHPKTRDFELFCEGTSNPWGVAFDTEGSAFVSACVIDHLWHLTETGYYHRQGGPYPAHTWKLGSIVKHKHQKAAYCGIHFFDSDAYPPEYRERLYMGNIHGGCINVDVLQRDGATYFAKPAPDFLTANDPWFMPVVQKTGPDGCLYILDWYDRYHCYQDANRDPAGIDRLRGRLYRVRYKNSPRAGLFDLSKESDEQLIERLKSANVFYRDLAQRLLSERNHPETRLKLQQLVLDEHSARKARMHALWALIGTGALDSDFHLQMLDAKDAGVRAWGVRAAGNYHKIADAVVAKVVARAADPSRDVQVQVAIAARKIAGVPPIPTLLDVLAHCGKDKLIPAIVWQNLHPLLDQKAHEFLGLAEHADLEKSNLLQIMPRAVERILTVKGVEPAALAALVRHSLKDGGDPANARQCLFAVADKINNGEISGARLDTLRTSLLPIVQPIMNDGSSNPVANDAALLAAAFRDPAGLAVARKTVISGQQPHRSRLQALEALITNRDAALSDALPDLLAASRANSLKFRGDVLASLGRLDDPRIAAIVLARYPQMESELQPRAVELLTQRVAWSKALLQAVAQKKVQPSALGVNQVRKLYASKDAELIKQVASIWGVLREERSPEREKIVEEMRVFLRNNRGDPMAGLQVFKNVCAQCHKIHGDGQDVGPDITSNGRADFEQLLNNVFDPNVVIGAAYQATTVVTTKGQTITGLLVEDNPERIVLKEQGGKLETVPRSGIDEIVTSKVSLMPEGLEKQLKPHEIADLFAFLTLDKPPTDPTARRIKGTPR